MSSINFMPQDTYSIWNNEKKQYMQYMTSPLCPIFGFFGFHICIKFLRHKTKHFYNRKNMKNCFQFFVNHLFDNLGYFITFFECENVFFSCPRNLNLFIEIWNPKKPKIGHRGLIIYIANKVFSKFQIIYASLGMKLIEDFFVHRLFPVFRDSSIAIFWHYITIDIRKM